MLKDYQVKNVKGKEWFRCSVSHAMKVIASVISPASEIDSVPDGKGEEEECSRLLVLIVVGRAGN